MVKYYCDVCGVETKENEPLYGIDMYVHIKEKSSFGGYMRHVHNKNGELQMEMYSGRQETTECCLVCYNKLMRPFWEEIEKMKTTNKGDGQKNN